MIQVNDDAAAERIGATIVRRLGRVIVSDRYRLTVDVSDTDAVPDSDTYEWTFDALRIGCPRCKQNQKAWLLGGTYHCLCGYSSTFSNGITNGTLHQASNWTDDDGEIRHVERSD